MEFEEKNAHGKEQNHRKARTKKSAKGSSVAEIDLKLQRLLHDIELGSSVVPDVSLPSVVILGNPTPTSEANLRNPDPSLDPKSSAHCNDDISRYQGGPSLVKCDVIDLLSPSPPRQPCTVSRLPQSNARDIGVIDLNESETDASPEHERKARELRLFLASIRHEVG